VAQVLVVDDDPDQITIRRTLIEHAGHQVRTASGPDQARQCFQEQEPDCVIMDLRLPRAEDGLALIRDLRTASPTVRLLVLSGFPADLRARPEANLVNRVLTKPCRSDQLLRLIAP
jgi:CheY-like chemotaxis protein